MHEHSELKQKECRHIYGYEHPQDGESALKHCEHCDVVYCDICEKEWGEHTHDIMAVPYPVPYIQPYPVYPTYPWWYVTPTWTYIPNVLTSGTYTDTVNVPCTIVNNSNK